MEQRTIFVYIFAILAGILMYYGSLQWQGSPFVASAAAFVFALLFASPELIKIIKKA